MPRDPVPHLRRASRPPYRRTGRIYLAYGFLLAALAMFVIRVSAGWWIAALVTGLGFAVAELLVQLRRLKPE